MEIQQTEAAYGLQLADGASKPGTVAEAAKEFESLLIAMLLKSAREANSSAWSGEEKDAAADSAFGFAEEHLADVLASRGGFGLAAMIANGLKPPPQAAEGANTRSATNTGALDGGTPGTP